MNDEIPTTAVYSMGVAERLTGLTARQIRYWEQYGLLAPARTRGRHRLYDDADILRLKEIKRLMAEGMGLAQVKQFLEARDRRRGSRLDGAATERYSERLPIQQTGPARSLYTGANRAAVQRLIDRKSSP